jgi:carboxyl-terminal processing protease
MDLWGRRGASRLRWLAVVWAIALAVVGPGNVSAQAPVPSREGLSAIEAGLAILLDRYSQPLEATRLLEAGWQGALQAAGGANPPVPAPEALPADRAAAWEEFQNRFAGLVAAGGDATALARAANQAMSRSLDDCHTRFAQSYERESVALAAPERYGGVGMISLDSRHFTPTPPGPVIMSLVDGAPAQAAGVRPGDVVVAVDGTDTRTLPSNRMAELIRGTPGTAVELRLDRPGEPEPVTVTLERAVVEIPLLESKILEHRAGVGPKIGYVRLRSFARPVEASLPPLLEELRAQGAEGWILDLRDNTGGEVRTFAAVASLFLDQRTLGMTIARDGAESPITGDGAAHRAYTQPLALLVSNLSASAAELMAADVQDFGAGRLFGTTTAGCFGTSQLFRLPDGTAYWVTTRALQSGGARRDVHKVGVTPDEVLVRTREDLATGRDPQLARALEWLSTTTVR